MKAFIKLFIILLCIFILAGAAFFIISNQTVSSIPFTGVEYEIKDGMSSYGVASDLKANNLIRSPLLFKTIIRILNLDKKLQPGWVLIKTNSSTLDIIRTIYSGKFIKITFTIPEGYTLKEIKALFADKQVATSDEITNFFKDDNYPAKIGLPGFDTAEGFLFPETYTFNKGEKLKFIMTKMVDMFYEKLGSVYPDYADLKPIELKKKITMASIIEKEVKNRSESTIVAGIFYNRIKERMRLQSCATVQYILNKPKERLLESDLEVDNPYNTYLYYGLPPGPISNPGLDSIKAAFHPDNNDYLFFVVKDPYHGTHYFSRDYSEHLKAKERYKAIKGFK